jgi:3-phenylpropionate/cinnamic acid dioxygenase small subunit
VTSVHLDARYAAVVQFLYHEAELLDDRRFDAWLELLAADVDYRIPTRVTRPAGATESQFSTRSFYMIDDFGSLKTRVQRFDTGYAFAEDPTSRTRRIVGNVRVATTDCGDELAVKSNVLLFRARSDGEPQLLAAERHDVLREAGASFRLARRLVLLDHTTLPMENLAIFL